jgi:dienelactone hydrolase
MNEVNFIDRYDNKPVGEGQGWVQLDIFGRTNNAYRFAGETDVFEAITDAKRRVRIDDRRITLWGFSMGGAGSWHLGLHHPSKWSSVGPGAGFVDFYKYQKISEPLPEYQHKALGIYDAIDYALNAYNVPVCTYGGELDEQLVASTRMVEEAKKLDVPMKLLIGPGVGHKFHPESFKEFLAFHVEHSKKGRSPYPGNRSLRFTTRTVKYNECDWLTVEELLKMYEPATVEAVATEDGTLKIKTHNVAALQLSRDIAEDVEIDGTRLPLNRAADGLLPGVYFERGNKQWFVLDYDSSRNFMENHDLRKRRNLQGPIDDAFMQPFVCVRGTGKAWSAEQTAWANWTLARFEREFDKWFRGRVPIVNDTEVTEEMIADKNLVLFGDPGSNSLIAKVLGELPIKWTEKSFTINGETYDPKTDGLSLVYPNPLNHRRYVVINSGHTFHEKDFQASNAWLFPRLGDIAVQKFEKLPDGGYKESVVWADLFNPSWQLVPPPEAEK